ncbi:MAG: TrkA family potassium uptake protein [Candidatus Diapherotrites archaeon]|nr:TrkA family potassium uptake protein [Candidatus Diapherotrites archaeon]
MRIVIVGATEFALELGKALLQQSNNKVTFFIEEKQRATQVSAETNAIVISADYGDTEALDELKLDQCEVFVAATDVEETNVLVALYARDAGVKQIFVRTSTEKTVPILRKLGMFPINMENLAMKNAELMITRPKVYDLINLDQGQMDMTEIHAKETKAVGKKIEEVRDKDYFALATFSEGAYHFEPERKIREDDTIILVCKVGKAKETLKKLK